MLDTITNIPEQRGAGLYTAKRLQRRTYDNGPAQTSNTCPGQARQYGTWKLAHWNIRTANGTFEVEAPSMIKRRGINLMAVCETKLPGEGTNDQFDGLTFHSSGYNPNSKTHGGVGFIHGSDVTCIEFRAINKRMAAGWFEKNQERLKVIVAYGPTEASCEKDDGQHERDQFYDQLSDLMTETLNGQHWPCLVTGDFNGKIGKDATQFAEVSGKHCILDETSEGGLNLIEFCEKNKLLAMNTMFAKNDIRLATWKHPGTRKMVTLDYILAKRNPDLIVQNVRASWADTAHSDHAMLIAILKVRKTPSTTTTNKRCRKPGQRNESMKEKVLRVTNSEEGRRALKRHAAVNPWNLDTFTDLEKRITDCVTKAANEIPPKTQSSGWFKHLDENARNILTERKKAFSAYHANRTDANRNTLRALNTRAKNSIKQAKEASINKKMEAFEELKDKSQLRDAYKTLKDALQDTQLTWFDRGKRVTQHVSDEKFGDHYKELFRARMEPTDLSEKEDNDDLGPPTDLEIHDAIRSMKSGKAPGSNGLTSDIFKILEDETMDSIANTFRRYWNSPKELPQEWKDARVCNLFKKGDKTDPNNYRSIFLLDVTGKIFAKIIATRLQKQIDDKLDRLQFGFRPKRSTGQAILAVRNLVQNAIETKEPMTLTFIDLKKAFDSVDRGTLWRAMDYFNVPKHMQKIIFELHTTPYGTTGKVKFAVNRGVRQGCVLGPILFIMVFHLICIESLTEEELNRLSFADDLALISKTVEDAQLMINKINDHINKAGMEISAGKTKFMRFNTEEGTIKINGCQIEEVDKFTYLGGVITLDGVADATVTLNYQKARLALVKLRAALVNGSLRKTTKLQILETFVKPILLYNLETIVTRQRDFVRLESVMNKGKRMIMKITDRRTKTVVELQEELPTKSVATQVAARRLGLYASYTKLKDDQLLNLLENRKIYTKDWKRQLKLDMEAYGLDSEWLNDPTPVKSGNFQITTRMVGARELNTVCINNNCERLFATEKEMMRHWRNDHNITDADNPHPCERKTREGPFQCPIPECGKIYKLLTWLNKHTARYHQTEPILEEDEEDTNNVNEETDTYMTITTGPPFECPLSDCHKTYKTEGWWRSHMTKCHPNTKADIIVSGDKPKKAPTPKGNEDNDTATAKNLPRTGYKCPLCPKQLPTEKGIVNHCSNKHQWSYASGGPVRERATRRAHAAKTSAGDAS